MITAKQLEQILKDKYLGQKYTDWEAECNVASTVRAMIQSPVDGYVVYNHRSRNSSLHRIVLREMKTGIESDLVSVIVKKKKGETHHYGYGRFGCSSTDYTYADFTVTMNDPDLETAVQNAVDDIKRQLDSRNDKIAKLKADVETVKKALGLANDWDVKYWAESVKSNWFKLGL